MNLCKVGNQTSSQDPHAVNSRVFVGNLNTFQVNKIDVEKVFQRYGRIVGISMHKGYAFVQFANPFDARSSCLGEDGRTISGQVVDVNMVSEPKAHQQSKPKNPTNKLQKNTDNNTPIANGPEAHPPQQPSSPSADGEGGGGGDSNGALISRKRARSEGNDGAAVEASLQSQEHLDLDSLKTYDIPDILICGNCKDLFSNLTDMIEHKKKYCKLRFTCKCGPPAPPPPTSAPFQALAPTSRSRGFTGNHAHGIAGDQPWKRLSPSEKPGDLGVSLLCTSCHESFAEPLELLIHVQETHSVEIFEEHNATTDSVAPATASATVQMSAQALISMPISESAKNEV